jgi:hypothetical protein
MQPPGYSTHTNEQFNTEQPTPLLYLTALSSLASFRASLSAFNRAVFSLLRVDISPVFLHRLLTLSPPKSWLTCTSQIIAPGLALARMRIHFELDDDSGTTKWGQKLFPS